MSEKDLNDLCGDILKLVLDMDEKMHTIIKRQE